MGDFVWGTGVSMGLGWERSRNLEGNEIWEWDGKRELAGKCRVRRGFVGE